MGWGLLAVSRFPHTRGDVPYGYFSNQEFDRLVDFEAGIPCTDDRQLLYIQAEQLLTEQEAGAIPLYRTLYYQQP